MAWIRVRIGENFWTVWLWYDLRHLNHVSYITDDTIQDHDLVLSVNPNGRIVMGRPGFVHSDGHTSYASSIRDIQKVRQDLRDLRVHSDNVIVRVDHDISELRLKVDEVTRRADSLHAGVNSASAIHDRSPESLVVKVRDATAYLSKCAELLSVKLDWGQSLKEHMQELREGADAVDSLLHPCSRTGER